MDQWRLLCLTHMSLRYLVVGRHAATARTQHLDRRARDAVDLSEPGEGRVLIMGWTDERVEVLKKLWLDGHSASQIAKQLGGVTRNAVIGKVHRLGLSGRAAPSHPSRPTFKTPRPPRPISMPAPRARSIEPRA